MNRAVATYIAVPSVLSGLYVLGDSTAIGLIHVASSLMHANYVAMLVNMATGDTTCYVIYLSFGRNENKVQKK